MVRQRQLAARRKLYIELTTLERPKRFRVPSDLLGRHRQIGLLFGEGGELHPAGRDDDQPPGRNEFPGDSPRRHACWPSRAAVSESRPLILPSRFVALLLQGQTNIRGSTLKPAEFPKQF